MNFLLTAIAFILIFSILVLIHEWGHFFAARKSGIKVEEFGFGLPPRLWGIKKGETLYSINAIPFGGFVRLFGEDDSDPKVKKNPRSYSGKSLRVRTIVVLAGVLMNFLLAWFLLTIGFSFGIQPLILSGDDILQGIQDGTIQTQPGIIVKKVDAGSPAFKAGMKPYDKILAIDQHQIFSLEQIQSLTRQAQHSLTIEVFRGEERLPLTVDAAPNGVLGISFYEFITLPRLQVKNLTANSSYYALNEDDILLKVNDTDIYTPADFQKVVQNARTDLDFVVVRNDAVQNVHMELPIKQRVVVSSIFPSTPAEKAEVEVGDILETVNGEQVFVPDDVVKIARKSANQTITYHLLRHGKEMDLQVTPNEKGLIGVGLTLLLPSLNNDISFFNRDFPTSVTKIGDVRYPVWVAPVKALEESGRLAVMTVQMFGNVLRSLLAEHTVPQGVTGPVGIAQLTYVFVQEGFLSLLRFMALLSLSLAIINVLPLPALDGGRFLFIMIEVVLGRRVNPKYEAYIHTLGFIFLLLVIVAITYSDIVKLF